MLNSGQRIKRMTFQPMKENNHLVHDPQLRALLRGTGAPPELPPRFQQNVWCRIEEAEAPADSVSWMESLAALILRPRLALATASVLILAGVTWGTWEGRQTAQDDARTQYLTSVTPHPLR